MDNPSVWSLWFAASVLPVVELLEFVEAAYVVVGCVTHNTFVTISTTHANTKLATQYIFFPLLIINPVSLVICP